MSAASAQPTIETGIEELLRDRPEADGRGTIVAVLDTGCDLAAAGLLKTSDGKPKYIDFLDCTGGGDIDMTKKVTRDEGSNLITGLSGRELQLGTWADNVSEFRLGAVRLYELLPGSVRSRLERERKAAFKVCQHQAVSEAQRKVATAASNSTASKAAKKDLETTLSQLNECMEDYSDAGPLLDVLLYKDAAGVWRVVVSTDSASADADNLSTAIPMAPFRHERQVGDLGFGTALSYVVQVYEEGDVVSIVVDSGSHGTHVAGIVAANFEDAPERNGVAPGAQILACKIGDGRLDAAETGTGLIRALIAAKKAGCDFINLSFGEPFYQSDKGRVAATFADAVRKWCMTVFTSAGNDGPALSTLGAPGHLTTPITVGAYISTAMMADQYSMLSPLPSVDEKSGHEVQSTSYSFTSRGPTPDGWLPTLCAPGGAIAPVPRHTLQGKAQYHGTSMASPNACGVAACVLSALRQSGINVGPIELRRALENSAKPVETSDVFAQGHGLINGPAALAYATEHHGKLAQDVEFKVTVPSRAGARGIYLRDAGELAGPLTFNVLVKPLFEHAFGPQRTEEELEALLGIDLDLKLASDADWVTTPESMVLTSGQERGGQTFPVRLDLSSLQPGVHFARVFATDAADPTRGPLFSLPVTVVIPHVMAGLQPTNLEILSRSQVSEDSDLIELPIALEAGAPSRRFIVAPESAEWASVKFVTRALPEGPHVVIFHAVPSARGDVPNAAVQVKRAFVLREHSEEVINVPVRGGSTLELCSQLSWLSNPAPAELTMNVEFHSYAMRGAAMASSRALRIGAADTYARVEIGAPLRTEALNPKAELREVQRALRPSDSIISAGSAELDVLPPSDAQRLVDAQAVGTQIHQMVLTYKFDIEPAGSDKTVSVQPRVASLHNQLYDSPLDSMLWRLENSVTGALIRYGGAMHDAPAVDLRKGSYAVKLLLRHPDPAQLKALEDVPLLLTFKLSKPLDLKVFSGRGAASSAGFGDADKVSDGWLRRGSHLNLYIGMPSAKDLPSIAAPGDALLGSVAVNRNVGSASSMPIVYEVPPAARKKGAGDDSSSDEDDDEDTLKKLLTDAKLKALTTLRKKGNSTQYEKLATAMYADNRTRLPLLLELLDWKRVAPAPGANASAKPEDDDAVAVKWRAEEVGKAADALFAPEGPIDVGELAQYWGVAHEDSAKLSKEEKKKMEEMEKHRKAMRLALYAKASFLAPHRHGIANITLVEEPAADAPMSPFIEAVKNMKQWVTQPQDLDEAEHDVLALTLADYELALGHPGAALATLRERLKAQPATAAPGAKRVAERCLALYRTLGWSHWASNLEELLANRFPVAKAPL